ncbi:hypothetical protein [Shewanella maritima]|uniref:hypothetical protein n=1 Tax=Shewanella maritima TaxID=2520507 RepID=UPI003735E4DC
MSVQSEQTQSAGQQDELEPTPPVLMPEHNERAQSQAQATSSSQHQSKTDDSADYYQLVLLRRSVIQHYIKRHPALILSFFYLLSTIVGLAYTYHLLGHFGVDVLIHLELTDFILSAIHHPVAFVTVLVVVIGFLGFSFYIDPWLMRRFPKYRDNNNQTYFKLRIDPIYIVLFVSSLLVMNMTDLVAKYDYKRFMRDDFTQYRVALIYPMARPQPEEVKVSVVDSTQSAFNNSLFDSKQYQLLLPEVGIISSSSRYLWLFQGENKPVLMVPHDNIASLLPQTQPQTVSDEQVKQVISTVDSQNALPPKASKILNAAEASSNDQTPSEADTQSDNAIPKK